MTDGGGEDSGRAREDVEAARVMDPSDIDTLLAGLATAAEEFLLEAEVAERRCDLRAEAEDRLMLARVARGRRLPDPQVTAMDLRGQIAARFLREQSDAARLLLAWWADAATVALVAAAGGGRVTVARMAAPDPCSAVEGSELASLPGGPSPQERSLAELGVWMATAPAGPDSVDDGMREEAFDFVARLGLRVDSIGDEGAVLVEDEFPDGRRRRLWGTAWGDHRVPALPDPGELATYLAEHAVPGATVVAVREAGSVVADALAAMVRARELEESDTLENPHTPETRRQVDALDAQGDAMPQILAHYARTATDAYTTLRNHSAT